MTGDRNAPLLAVADAVMDRIVAIMDEREGTNGADWRDEPGALPVRDAIYDALASSSASGAERMREAVIADLTHRIDAEEQSFGSIRDVRRSSAEERVLALDAARSRIHALPLPDPAPVPAWRPIETAPKDGTYVLLNFDNRPPTVARWLYGAWQAFDVLGFIGAPTHWQPLPLPPETSDHAR